MPGQLITFSTGSFSGSFGTDGSGNIIIQTDGNSKQIIFDGTKAISGSKELEIDKSTGKIIKEKERDLSTGIEYIRSGSETSNQIMMQQNPNGAFITTSGSIQSGYNIAHNNSLATQLKRVNVEWICNGSNQYWNHGINTRGDYFYRMGGGPLNGHFTPSAGGVQFYISQSGDISHSGNYFINSDFLQVSTGSMGHTPGIKLRNDNTLLSAPYLQFYSGSAYSQSIGDVTTDSGSQADVRITALLTNAGDSGLPRLIFGSGSNLAISNSIVMSYETNLARMGINKTHPTKELEVQGSISASGDIYSSNLYVTSSGESVIQVGNGGTTLSKWEWHRDGVRKWVIYNDGRTNGYGGQDSLVFKHGIDSDGDDHINMYMKPDDQTVYFHGDISASNTASLGPWIKSALPTGTDLSVVILDSDGYLKTDEVDGKVFDTGLIGSAGGGVWGSSHDGKLVVIEDGDNNTLEYTDDIKITNGQVTASGNISSSATMYMRDLECNRSASFNYITASHIDTDDNSISIGGERITKTDWRNVKRGKFSDISGTGNIKLSGSILPSVNATKIGGFSLGSKDLRWSKVYVASTIDVSGSSLVISPSASAAAGDDFNVVISGSILPANSSSDSIGSQTSPFADLYVTTASIKFVKDGAVVDTMSKDDWNNVKRGKFSDVSGTGDIKISGSLLPSVNASKAGGFNLGSKSLRWSTIYAASTIDVSGSSLIISPSASMAAGDDFSVVISGSILPADSDTDSIGSETYPFKDLYVTTGSIIYVDKRYDVGDANRKTAFGKEDVERLREGKPLKDRSGNRVKARLSEGAEITGSLIISGPVSASNLQLGDVDVTSTAAELNILDGVTSTTSELNILDGVTATAAELNIMDGVTATTTELNYVDGVTSAIQTQLRSKASAGGGFSWEGAVGNTITSFTNSDTTPTVRRGNVFMTANKSSTTISKFDDGTAGQQIIIIVSDRNTTFAHGGGRVTNDLFLASGRSFVASEGDTITFVFSGKYWYEVCRSDNT